MLHSSLRSSPWIFEEKRDCSQSCGYTADRAGLDTSPAKRTGEAAPKCDRFRMSSMSLSTLFPGPSPSRQDTPETPNPCELGCKSKVVFYWDEPFQPQPVWVDTVEPSQLNTSPTVFG